MRYLIVLLLLLLPGGTLAVMRSPRAVAAMNANGMETD